MSSWTDLLEQAKPEDHVVQLYGEDDQLLAKNVSRYLAEGLRRLDGLLVIATADHTQAIARQLTQELGGLCLEAEREGRLVFRDAAATLERLMRNGRPDKAAFDSIIGDAIGQVRERSGSGKVRAFGEMVSLLWREEQFEAAALLESYWNAILEGGTSSLYCAYGIDLFADRVDPAGLRSIVSAHTHVFAGPRTILSSRRAHL